MTLLQLDGVVVRYGQAVAVDGVSLTVGARERVALIGPNGAGKTSVLNAACGVVRPASGRVRVDGEDVTGMTESQLEGVRRKVQLVFQSGALFDSLTVWENVAFPLQDAGLSVDEIEACVAEKLRLVEIEDLAEVMPSELSTGMKRAVAIARPGASKFRLVAGIPPLVAWAFCLSAAWTSAGDPGALPTGGLGAFRLVLGAILIGPVVASPSVRSGVCREGGR